MQFNDQRNGHIGGPPSLGKTKSNVLGTALAAAVMASALTFQPIEAAHAYQASDYASETVQEAVKILKDASGNKEETFKAYESIAAIITEGKGVGGQINYRKWYVVHALCSTVLIVYSE